jgi:hypothetical protein
LTEESATKTDSAASLGYFSPDRAEHRYLAFGGRVTVGRLVLRLVLAALVLVALDAAVARTLTPNAAFEDAYRLPQVLPTASLADFAQSIHDASLQHSGGPIVAFLGASPTWGYRIKDPHSTFPAAFQSTGARAGWPNRTYNLASNGQFAADEYVVAKRVSQDADIVFIQLTYHTFNPKARNGAILRFPELPQVLGVDVSPAEGRLLGVAPSASTNVTTRAEKLLNAYWLLWRERDALDRRLFGGRPQALISGAKSTPASSLTSLPPDAESADASVRFDQLPIGKRIVAITRYSDNSSFRISPDDAQVVSVGELSKLLATRNKKAVFWIAPFNREVVDEYELINQAQYRSNVAVLRAAVASAGAGFPFLDYNSGPMALPSSQFADISHTTDAGGRAVGQMLYRNTWRYLGAKQP